MSKWTKISHEKNKDIQPLFIHFGQILHKIITTLNMNHLIYILPFFLTIIHQNRNSIFQEMKKITEPEYKFEFLPRILE